MGRRTMWRVGLIALGCAAFAGQGSVSQIEPGSIVGTVTAYGVAPSAPLEVNTNRDFCGSQLPSEAIVISSEGGVRYAVVHLDGIKHDADSQPTALAIRNEGCIFAPHVQAGLVNSKLEVTNHDPILHNTRLQLDVGSRWRSLINLALPTEGVRLDATRATRGPGVIRLKCDAHEWMSGYMLLFDHPFYDVSDADGRFAINDVPAGTYALKVWHETLGEIEEQVIVEQGKSTKLTLRFEASVAEVESESG